MTIPIQSRTLKAHLPARRVEEVKMRRNNLDWLWSNRPLLIAQIIGVPLVVAWLLYAYFHGHVTFALVLVFLLPVFAFANVVIISRSRRRLSDSSAARIS
jgi:hypothetical protein